MRIVVSGSSGSGKTTLATALAVDLGVPLLGEGMKTLYQSKTRFLLMEAERRPKAELEQGLKDWVNEFFLWVQVRGQEYEANKSFVADRWEADLLFAWLGQFGSHRVNKQTSQLVSILRERSKSIDLIVLTPISSGRAPSLNEDGLVRRQTLAAQLGSRSMVIGLIQQFSKTPVLVLPSKDQTTAERVAFVKARVRDLGIVKAS